MKTFYIHLGAPKCGSTTVQALLLNSESPGSAALKEDGIFPALELYNALRERASRLGGWSALWGDAEACRAEGLFDDACGGDHPAVFYSEEALSGLAEGAGGVNETGAVCRFLKAVTAGHRCRILFHFRRQDGLIESLYNQDLRRGGVLAFEDYIRRVPLANFHWLSMFETFSDAFGTDNVTAIPLEQRVLDSHPSPPANFVDALTREMGFSGQVSISEAALFNPSVAVEHLELVRSLNGVVDRRISELFDTVYKLDGEDSSRLRQDLYINIAGSVADVIAEAFPKKPGERAKLFLDEDRAKVVAFYAESNRRLFDKYLPDYDPSYYLP